MKNTTKVLATVIVSGILVAGIASTYAMWNGQWQLNRQGNWGSKGLKMTATQDCTQTYRQNRTNSWSTLWNANGGQRQWKGNWMKQGKTKGTPWIEISDIPLSDLSEQEKLDLMYHYSEEMVARDAYNYFYTLYGTKAFANIAKSEQQHMDAVKVLLDRYSLDTPTSYGELQSTFDALKAEWEKWLKEALEVWIKIEILDIKDIDDTKNSTDNEDIKLILTNIWNASYNHLRSFVKNLTNNGFTTDIDYSEYLN